MVKNKVRFFRIGVKAGQQVFICFLILLYNVFGIFSQYRCKL